MNLNDEKRMYTLTMMVVVVVKGRRHSRPQIMWNIWNNCRRILIKIPQYPKRINPFPRNKSGIYTAPSSPFASSFCDSLHLSVRQVELKSAVDNGRSRRREGREGGGWLVYKYRVSRSGDIEIRLLRIKDRDGWYTLCRG